MSRVWYVAYGSNLAAARLGCYLTGGCPPGGSRANPGARDRTLPTRSEPVDLPGTTYFAGESPQWGGGVAFYDHEEPGRTAARAYLVTPGQLADIAAQEMYRLPADGDPVEELVLGPLHRHTLGPGRYETLVRVGELEGMPLLTFTSPHGARAVEHTEPAPAYLATMATGLRESRGWSDRQISDYLDSLLLTRFDLVTFEHSRTVTTSATAHDVWALWSDPGSWHCWDPSVESVALEGHFAEGAMGTMVLAGGVEVPVFLELVEPGSRYLDRLEMGELRIHIDHVVKDCAEGAEVTVSTTVVGPGAEDIGPVVTADAPKAMAALCAMAEGH